MNTFRTLTAALSILAMAATGCADQPAATPDGDDGVGQPKGGVGGKYDTSVEAIFVNFEFDGELRSSSCWNADQNIEDQLLYTIGQLNGENSVGRLDKLDITDLQKDTSDGCHIKYHARLPVAWGLRNEVPETYKLLMPRDVSYQGTQAFTEKYSHSCVDYGAHDVDSGSMWYYYRPASSRCDLADEDVFAFEATVTVSPINTTGKYPEYHQVWKDGVLEVVAVFGKYEDGVTSNSDSGISAYNRFLGDISRALSQHDLTTTPADVPDSPGVSLPEVTFEATLDEGHRVRVVAILVDNVRTAGAAFDARYEELSTTADLLAYNGHAGLGANIRALANKGKWVAEQYVIVFMNGCDTHAYVDDALATAHMAVNPDDETGTKYVDIVTNAMPSFFRSMDNATMALVNGLMAYEAPRTYEQMFREVDSSQVIMVSGEQDNVYHPGYDPGTEPEPGVEGWEGLDAEGTVVAEQEISFETPVLAAGPYLFELDGDGDADLYVRVGAAPTVDSWDCRPYLSGSREVCELDLNGAAKVFVNVRGWAETSKFHLIGQTDNDR